jgi:signal transduction histidine kinase
MINDLLEIARSESGTITIAVKECLLRPILDQVLDKVSPLVKEKNIALETHLDRISNVLCDETKLREVLLNLLSNAIKYNRERGTITIDVHKAEGTDDVVFKIRDTGYGIAKEQQDKIFQKFFRAVTKDTQGVVGTGLGLFLTRMLVEKMGGHISFESVEGQGTTFTFTLPTVSVAR